MKITLSNLNKETIEEIKEMMLDEVEEYLKRDEEELRDLIDERNKLEDKLQLTLGQIRANNLDEAERLLDEAKELVDDIRYIINEMNEVNREIETLQDIYHRIINNRYTFEELGKWLRYLGLEINFEYYEE